MPVKGIKIKSLVFIPILHSPVDTNSFNLLLPVVRQQPVLQGADDDEDGWLHLVLLHLSSAEY